MASLDEAKQILKRDVNGRSLYDHLSEVLLKVLVDKPADALDSFEHVSAAIKRLALAPKPVPDYADDVDDAQTTRITKTKQLAWAKSSSALLKKPDEPAADGYPPYPDLVDDANLYEWAGVSFGKEETYRLFLSIKRFAETLPGDHGPLRFFGRVNTRTTPYYVLEGSTFEDPEVMDPELQEGKDGANKHTYWVARHAGDAWVKLPVVTSGQLVAARKISHYLTGNLEASVPGYPPFPGLEKHFLAVQLVRIASSTSVSPAGFWALDEDSEAPLLKPAEPEAVIETFPKPAEELKAPDAWVHHELEVNTIGRVRPLPDKEDEEGNPIERDNPESSAPLKSLAEDAEGSWTFRVTPGGAGENGQSLVVARSLVWPGASAISFGRRWAVVYNGDAVKYRPSPYIVDSPPPIQSEWAPAEGEEEAEALLELPDLLIDPTPPVEPEGEE